MSIARTLLATAAACLLAAPALNGCSVVNKIMKSQAGGGQTGGPSPGPATPADSGQAAPMTGYWQVAFQLGDKTMKANMRLEQHGAEFTGEGTDDPSGREFVIEEGYLDKGAVHFFKRYPQSDAGAVPPVEYTGKFEVVNDGELQGPYMSGEYATTFNGNPIRGIWEASIVPQEAPPPEQPPAQPGQPASEPAPAAPPVDPNRAPHLSGKWEVGYEYKFKTIKSVMFLEQDGGLLKGHGEDKNTKEKFTIEKGWYNFPRITIVRKYTKGKGAAADRTMTFKASVSTVNDADYQGPYLRGKTEGGGEWEAQMYK